MIGDVDPAALLSALPAAARGRNALGRLLLDGDAPDPQGTRLRLGAVTAVAATTVSVRISGQPTAVAGVPYVGAQPISGATVALIQTAGSYLVLGVLTGESSAAVRLTEGLTDLTANTWQAVTGLSLVASRGTGLNVSAGVVSVTTPGWYRIGGQASFGTGSPRYLMRVVDGSNPETGVYVIEESPGGGDSRPALNGSTEAYLPAGAALRLFLLSTAATTTDLKSLTVRAV